MFQSLTSFLCCAKIVTPPSHLEKVSSKKCIPFCSDYRWYSVYTVLSSWPCLFPLFVLLLLLRAPQCCENFNRRPALKCLWAFTKHQLMPLVTERQSQSQADSLVLVPFIASQMTCCLCVALESKSVASIFLTWKMTSYLTPKSQIFFFSWRLPMKPN